MLTRKNHAEGRERIKTGELLASCDFAGLLKEAGLHFDRIVLDSAPINAVSDTQLIAKEIQSVYSSSALSQKGQQH